MSSRFALRLAPLLAIFASYLVGCKPTPGPTVTCYPEKGCYDQYGNKCDADGKNCVSQDTGGSGSTTASGGTGTGDSSGGSGTGTGTGSSGGGTVGPTPPVCNCPVVQGALDSLTADNDGDCLPNGVEHGSVATIGNANHIHSGDPSTPDTDGDGIRDGCEDKNHNGLFDPGEEDPTSVDTDGDGLTDPQEDVNLNGVKDYSETNAAASDTDHDGILDGLEDADHDSKVKQWVDKNGNGKFDPGVDTAGESDPRLLDTDADGIPDQLEDKNSNGVYDPGTSGHETIAWMNDTDGDGIPDGKEDKNHNGAYDAGETDPTSTDTDGDGLADGLEDLNHNGTWDATETNPTLVDTDNDGLADGVEDRNQNGVVDPFVDTNSNGCWDASETQGETDPRKNDSDGDGIPDGVEDRNQNGQCDAFTAPDPVNPGNTVRTFVETCAWLKDTDCDGLAEKAEDRNANGSVDIGETDPRRSDSDYDGLADGCTTASAITGCEDKNNNGAIDAGETDPTRPDSDGDSLPDGCEFNFGPHPPAGGTNPLALDSDNDGYADAEEDLNHNCIYEPNLNETDPRVANPAPASNSNGYAQWSVCAPDNLNGLTYATSARPNQDFRLAFEVEKTNTRPCGTGSTCPAGQQCVNGNCLLTASYTVQPFGKDADGGGFNPDNFNDILWGYVFQSPQGVVTDLTTSTVLSRDIYGFVRLASGSDIDQILEDLRTEIVTLFGASQVTQGTTLTSRAAFDSTANVPVYFAQRDLELNFQNPNTALSIRNVLLNKFLNGATPQPLGTPPTTDPVYGAISTCSVGVPHCYNNFRLKIGAVQRPSQIVDGAPFVILVVALTPDDSNPVMAQAPQNRFFADRLSRLDDLTGGSAVARFAASTGKSCDHQPQTLARADMLWVVDDSRSMQAIIGRVDQATKGAVGVLKANTHIVDVRVGMTTTNPSKNARTLCPTYCSETCQENSNFSGTNCAALCADVALGCIKSCPDTCMSASSAPTCSGSDNSCVCNGCGTTYPASTTSDCCSGDGCYSVGTPAAGSCYDPGKLAGPTGAIAQDLVGTDRMLPGGGGTFFYESTHFMDCDANPVGTTSQKSYLNQCYLGSYSNNQLVKTFYANGVENGGVLTKNAGMLHSDPNASCPTSPLTLYYDASAALAQSCTSPTNPTDPNHPCCDRLVNSCSDGASVLASQMCDLVRQMGGVSATVMTSYTASARRHSAPEMGSRSARRLLESMLPAYPYNMSDSTSPLYDPNSVKHLRRTCAAASATDPVCGTCDPRLDPNCKLFPLATVILSDEEDFWLKDECMRDETPGNPVPDQARASMMIADRQQLPSGCYYVDGDPNTLDTCTVDYCSNFFGGSTAAATVPTGYDPDQAAMTSDASYTLAYTSPTATQCQASNPNNCLMDPCPDLTTSTSCTTLYGPQCSWNPSIVLANGTTQHLNGCFNRCILHVYDGSVNTDAGYAAQTAACVADSYCRWDQSMVTTQHQDPANDAPGACLPKHPVNDCQPCKRYLRERDAVLGTSNLVGFGNIGPVFALTRNPNEPGRGNILGDDIDACRGGSITWGRGDGAAYRDMAAATNGGTYDVCSADYGEFMKTITSQLAVLSIPYPLSGAPIAATIKVGLSRSNGDGTYSYVAVPRSTTSGFIYDATTNSVGFKSDPVDGACDPPGSCSADNVITDAEIKYASNANTVPRTGDVVYISYRVWDPIPCGGDCPSGQSCAQVICRDDNSSCSGSCTSGDLCTLGQCCAPGTIVEACVDTPNCGQCQDYNTTTHKCETQDPNSIPAGTCPCNPGQTATCNPNGSNTCSLGFACNETCVCEAVPGCAPGTFKSDGTVTDCTAALACCTNFSNNANQCVGKNQAACTPLAPNCAWRNNSCQYAFQTCCATGSTAACTLDPESGVNSVYCVPAPCSCQTKGCENLNPPQECDPGNNCACFTNGT